MLVREQIVSNFGRINDCTLCRRKLHASSVARPLDRIEGSTTSRWSNKSFTAKKINELLRRSGSLWQKESFDHIVRSPGSFERLRAYIADNPRKLSDGVFTLGMEAVGWNEEALERRDAASTFEPASMLLERILVERRRRWEEAELAALKAKGKTPKNDKWKAKYKEPVAPDEESIDLLPPLPPGQWHSLKQSTVFV